MRSVTFTAAAAILAVGCAGVPPQDHVGFHFHADVGVAGSQSRTDFQGDRFRMSGVGAGFSVAVGGALARNVILAGELWGTSVSEPDMEINGQSQVATDTSYGVIGIGPQLKLYAMPANVFFSVTPSATRLTLSDQNSGAVTHTRWGYGLRASVGKEWQLGGWGMGVAGVVDFASNRDQDVGTGSTPTWRTYGGGVVFSASLN